ncbi:MAG: SDR family NAD(P)-dependent oxidoreductase, partial [Pseudomonadota bacterium]
MQLKTALITGGAKRIGKAITEHLADHGWAVAIHCNASKQAGIELADTLIARGGKAHVIEANLSDFSAVHRIVPEAVEALGPIDLLVNNASVFEA